MVPSKYQTAFYNTVLGTQSNIVLKASAGAAKTTSLVECCKYIPFNKKVVFTAFNRHTVEHLKSKLLPTVDCFTMHSIGMRAIMNHYGQGTFVEKEKQIKYLIPLFEKEKTKKLMWANIMETDHLLKLMRATMTPYDEESIETMAQSYNLFPDKNIVLAALVAGNKMRQENEEKKHYGNLSIDFQDMVSLCVTNREINMPQYDYVLLDEAQDFSKVDQMFIERLIKQPRGRLISVGDPRQSCYGFRGADINSFEYFEKRANTITLPLSISYRCGKNIVKHAKEIYSEIEEWEDNIDGQVIEEGDVEQIQNGDIVVCRNIRPLVSMFFKLLDQGKKSTILGKELEKGLLGILKGIDNSASVEELHSYLEHLLATKAMELKQGGSSNPLGHPKYNVLEEKVLSVKVVSKQCSTVQEVEMRIQSIFNDDQVAPIKLLTIHKSKGLENNNVFVIRTFEGKKLIPNQYAITPSQLIQEKNLEFIAATRAKNQLVYVDL